MNILTPLQRIALSTKPKAAFLVEKPHPDTLLVIRRRIRDLRAMGVSTIYLPTAFEGGWNNQDFVSATHDVLELCSQMGLTAYTGCMKPTKANHASTGQTAKMGGMWLGKHKDDDPTVNAMGQIMVSAAYLVADRLYDFVFFPKLGNVGNTRMRWRRKDWTDSRFIEFVVSSTGQTRITLPTPEHDEWWVESLTPGNFAYVERIDRHIAEATEIRDLSSGEFAWLGHPLYCSCGTQPRWEMQATMDEFKAHISKFWAEFGWHPSLKRGGLFGYGDEPFCFGWDSGDLDFANIKEMFASVYGQLANHVKKVTGRPLTLWGDFMGGHNDDPALQGLYANNWDACAGASVLDYLPVSDRKNIRLLLWGPEKFIGPAYHRAMLFSGFAELIPTANDQDSVNEAWAGLQRCWYLEPSSDQANMDKWIRSMK